MSEEVPTTSLSLLQRAREAFQALEGADVSEELDVASARQAAQSLLEEAKIQYQHELAQGEFQNTPLAQETALLWEELSQDDSVQYLREEGQELVSEWLQFGETAEAKNTLHTLTGMVSSAQQELQAVLTPNTRKSIVRALSDAKQTMAVVNTDDLLSNLDATVTKDTVSALALEKLGKIRNNKSTHELLDKASDFLAQHRDQLRPDALISKSKQLISDGTERKAFLEHLKNTSLGFLMSYLPTVSVPDITGIRDGIEYKLAGIDLAGFQVLAEHTDVSIVGPGIKLKATEMKCHLQDFTWTYKMKYFPYFQGTGKANATTQSMTFDLHLALEGADNLTQAVLQAADTVQEEETHKVQALVSELAELPISEGLRLNIVTQRIHLTDLTMEVSESWFSHVYNVLVKVFTEQVVTALEAKLNAELVDKTDELLDLVNDLAQDYLPVLQEIQVKAGGSEQVMPAKRLSKTRMHANLTKALAESQDGKTATVVAADTFFDEDMD